MKDEQAARARAGYLPGQLRVPPGVVDIDRDLEHPEFVALVNNENLMGARRLKRSKLVPQLYSPLLETLTEVLRRGQKAKVFRSGVDPMQLYISIAALGYFYCSNIRTLSVIFVSDLDSPAGMKQRQEHVIEVVMGFLRR